MALLFPLLAVALVVWMIHSQRQRVTNQRRFISSLAVGEEVVTAGGIIGRIRELSESEVSLEIAPGTVVRFAVTTIVRRMNPPTPDDEGVVSGEDPGAETQGGSS